MGYLLTETVRQQRRNGKQRGRVMCAHARVCACDCLCVVCVIRLGVFFKKNSTHNTNNVANCGESRESNAERDAGQRCSCRVLHLLSTRLWFCSPRRMADWKLLCPMRLQKACIQALDDAPRTCVITMSHRNVQQHVSI